MQGKLDIWLYKFVPSPLVVVLVCALGSPALADPIPPGWEAQNMQPVGYSEVGGRKGAFKMAIRKVNSRWYLYTSHLWHYGWSIIDVTDPKNPRAVKFIEGADNTWNIQVSLHDNIMVTALQKSSPAWGGDPNKPNDEGVLIWDIADPENPKQLSHWKTGATGTHRNSYPGGRYAYLSAGMAGFSGNILVILDIANPREPKEAGRWWMPGQKAGEAKGEGPEGFHGPANISPDGKLAAMGYSPAVINLDITNVASPKLVGRLNFSPPFAQVGGQSLHTVLPLWDRDLLYVNSEGERRALQRGAQFRGPHRQQGPGPPPSDLAVPNPGAAQGGALQELLREGRTLWAAQRQSGNPPSGRREARQPDLSHLFQRWPARRRHQGPIAAGRDRLVHSAQSDCQCGPAAQGRGNADRGRAG
jgi:LVIVD repeat